MALLIVYTVVVTALVALACHLGERCLMAFGRTTRAVWLAGVVLAVSLPVTTVIGVERISQPVKQHPRVDIPTTTNAGPAKAIVPVAIRLESVTALLRPLDGLLMWMWAASSMLFLLALGASVLRARRMVVLARKARVGGVPVRLTHHVGPALVGIIRYDIVIPQWVIGLPSDQQALIVAHEQEHARVFDPILVWIAAIATVAFPWNAGLWYMMRRLRTSIELDCDRRVLCGTRDSHAYASLLLEVGARMSSRPFLAAALSESASQLERRILAMSSFQMSWTRTRTMATAAVACFLCIAAVRVPTPEIAVLSAIETQSSPAMPGTRTALVLEEQSPRNIASVSVRSAKSVAVLVYTTESAGVGVGSSRSKLSPDTLHVTTPVALTADLTAGEVHIVSFDGTVIDVSVTFLGSPATKAEAHYEHVVLLRGGVGVGGPPSVGNPLAKRESSTERPPVGSYFEYQVDKAASQYPGSGVPQYPAALRAAKVEGEVLVQFVAGANGLPDPKTFRVLRATNDLFADAVRSALSGMRYSPAEIRGKKVPQLVQQSFQFRLDGSTSR